MSRTHATVYHGERGMGNGEREKKFQMHVRWPRARFLAFMSGDGAHSKQKDEANHEHEENLCYGSGDDCCHMRFRAWPPRMASPSPPRTWSRGRHRRPDGGNCRTRARHHRSRSCGLLDACRLSSAGRRACPRGRARTGRRACSGGRRAGSGRISGSSRLPAPLPPLVLVIAHGETAAFLIYYARFFLKGHAYK